jgi:Asp-tRNA(Asn)/Glu-tRNA(Gln) amidotransferase C subunit
MIQRADTADQSAEAGSGEDAAAALRDDSLEPGLDHDQVMILAPESVEGFIRVPRIIDRE